MGERRAFEWSDPDDPYQIRSWFDEQGNFHLEVSADVLTGGDTAEVQAEVKRRADLYRQMLEDFVKPKGQPPVGGSSSA